MLFTFYICFFFFFQAEDGIRDAQESRGLGDVYKRQDVDSSKWYCKCGGLLDDSASGSTRIHIDFLETWNITIRGMVMFSACSVWFALIGYMSGPRARFFKASVLQVERMWILQWFQLWVLAQIFVGLESPWQAAKYGAGLFAGCILAHTACWFGLFVCSSCPSASRVRSITYWSVVACLIALGFETMIRHFMLKLAEFSVDGTFARSDWDALGSSLVAYGAGYLILVGYICWARIPRLPSCKTLHDFWNFQGRSESHRETENELESDLYTEDSSREAGLPSLAALAVIGLLTMMQGIFTLRYHPDTYCYTSSYLREFRGPVCLLEWTHVLKATLIPPCFLWDLLLHNFLWGRMCHDVVLQTFVRNVDWRKYRREPFSWRQHDMIAMGAEGAVYLAHLNEDPDGQLVVLKKPHITGSRALRATMQEAAILAQIHESLADSEEPGAGHIVALRGFCPVLPEVALLLEYCTGGDLLHKLKEMRPDEDLVDNYCEEFAHNGLDDRSLSLQLRLEWGVQIALGMKALHSIGVAHRDLKTDNILLTQGMSVRISDFGCATIKRSGQHDRFATANAGTMAFMAPEVVSISRSDSLDKMLLEYNPIKVDAFSYGFVLFECLTFRREPGCRASMQVKDFSTEHTVLAEADFYGSGVPFAHELVRTLQKCFDPNPDSRPGFDEICSKLQSVTRGSSAVLNNRLGTFCAMGTMPSMGNVQDPSDANSRSHPHTRTLVDLQDENSRRHSQHVATI
eukprot:TRINITY_DN1623_c0_g1_i11.p1 TRINITY_DN1623_c0_g1~~TRINITY_DN1623_c0_g1_i11.p1  ORF type:complete len:744 (+),score=76.45 TRINITY_DN1623_c0_g1_i11:75-2306(+)